MNRSLLVTLIVLVTALIAVAGLSFLGPQKSSPKETGTSVVVLVDFSKSFPATIHEGGKVVYGFRREDQRALDAIAGVLAELASGASRFKTVWAQIQTSSITQSPLFPTIEMQSGIIKRADAITTADQLRDTLKKGIASMVAKGKNSTALGDFSDISSAIAMASDVSSPQYNDKILLVFSDFLEDLPQGSHPAFFQLNGERVVLLHRPGTDEREDIDGYLARIEGWKKKLISHGAKTVATLPVFAMSEARLRAALQKEELGSSIILLVDCKDERFSPRRPSTNPLVRIGKGLAELSREEPPPITALWMSVGSPAFASNALPFVEFHPRMIKRGNSLNSVEDFGKVMEELALALPNIGKATYSTDISGTLALVCSVDPAAKSSILVVVSDFLDERAQHPIPFKLAPNTRVVMVHTASSKDHSNPNRYLSRRYEWEKRFRESGAASVCQISLEAFTQTDLGMCLDSGKSK